jgi:hypothetical protein
MEAVVNDVPEKEQRELKNLLRSGLTFYLTPYLIFLHPHVSACVIRRFHKEMVYRKLREFIEATTEGDNDTHHGKGKQYD